MRHIFDSFSCDVLNGTTLGSQQLRRQGLELVQRICHVVILDIQCRVQALAGRPPFGRWLIWKRPLWERFWVMYFAIYGVGDC